MKFSLSMNFKPERINIYVVVNLFQNRNIIKKNPQNTKTIKISFSQNDRYFKCDSHPDLPMRALSPFLQKAQQAGPSRQRNPFEPEGLPMSQLSQNIQTQVPSKTSYGDP